MNIRLIAGIVAMALISVLRVGAEGLSVGELLDAASAADESVTSASFSFRLEETHSKNWLAEHRAKLDAALAGIDSATPVVNPRAAMLEKKIVNEGTLLFDRSREVRELKQISAADGYLIRDVCHYVDKSEGTEILFDRNRRKAYIDRWRKPRSDFYHPLSLMRIYNEGRTWEKMRSGDASFILDSVEPGDRGGAVFKLRVEIPVSDSESAIRTIWIDPAAGYNVTRAENMSIEHPDRVFSTFSASYREVESGIFFPSRVVFVSRPGDPDAREEFVLAVQDDILVNLELDDEAFRFDPSPDIRIYDRIGGEIIPSDRD